MNFKGVDICCPHCREELNYRSQQALVCLGCGRLYPVVMDIPDLRIFPDPYIGIEDDQAKARRLAEQFHNFGFEGFVDFYYGITPGVPKPHASLYKRGLMAAEARTAAWLESWETTSHGDCPGSLLEIGCGTAPLLAGARHYRQRVGVDIALRWLVVAKKRLTEAGVDLPLICACAEALPFPDASFDRLVADSVIEHLQDQRRAMAEVLRVLRPGGRFFVATPNRFSLGPDPQTGIWGGGWLPRRWTDALVRRQGGIPPQRSLLSFLGLRRLLQTTGFESIRIFLPSIPREQRRYFSPMMNRLLGAYDLARRVPVSRYMLYWVGPLLHAVATRKKTTVR